MHDEVNGDAPALRELGASATAESRRARLRRRAGTHLAWAWTGAADIWRSLAMPFWSGDPFWGGWLCLSTFMPTGSLGGARVHACLSAGCTRSRDATRGAGVPGCETPLLAPP